MRRLPVAWSPQARCSLDTAARFAAADRPAAARQLVIGMLAAAERLSALPERGRPVPEAPGEDFREIFWKSYRIIYVVRPEGVVIVEIKHQRQLLSARELRAI